MYSLAGYGSMIADQHRMEAYARALESVIRPGSVVVDLGSGTGIFSFLACQFGARRVFALEPDDAIQVAREIARANGFDDRIEFIQELSTSVTLPERADVIVSDLRDILPPFQRHLPSIVDARARHLKHDGTLIPQRDTLWAAVVEAPESYGKLVDPWSGSDFKLDLSAARNKVLNTVTKVRLKPEALLTEPHCWASLDYTRVESPNIAGAFSASLRRAGTAHGILIWFDSVLLEGIGFSNSPCAPELIYGSAFFPWLEPVVVEPGDHVALELQANLVGEDYVWRWKSRVLEGGDSSSVKAEFDQSSFFGVPVVPGALHKRATNHLPVRNEEGEVNLFVLSLMGADTTVAEIAARLQERFPNRFRQFRDALTHVGDIAVKYSR
jgi:protein arginine N-methyltransferase 1